MGLGGDHTLGDAGAAVLILGYQRITALDWPCFLGDRTGGRGEEPNHAIKNIEHRRTSCDQLDQHDRCPVPADHFLYGWYPFH